VTLVGPPGVCETLVAVCLTTGAWALSPGAQMDVVWAHMRDRADSAVLEL